MPDAVDFVLGHFTAELELFSLDFPETTCRQLAGFFLNSFLSKENVIKGDLQIVN